MTREGFVWCKYCSAPHRLTERFCPNTGAFLELELHRTSGAGHPLLGTVLDGKYALVGVLGRGGHGIVFDGEHVQTRERVAVKIVGESRHDDPFARLWREVKIVSSLRHPNICQIRDWGRLPDGGPYLVTERLFGETIAARFRRQRRFGVGETVNIVSQILAGLASAHALNVVHRDVKPGNVFIVERQGFAPVAKLLDFGLARDMSAAGDPRLTRPGVMLGTVKYMAPEQLMGIEAEPVTDLFAVGVVVFEMLTGAHPFGPGGPLELRLRALRGEARTIGSLREGVPAGLEVAVARSLQKRPADRFPDANAMLHAMIQGVARGAVT